MKTKDFDVQIFLQSKSYRLLLSLYNASDLVVIISIIAVLICNYIYEFTNVMNIVAVILFSYGLFLLSKSAIYIKAFLDGASTELRIDAFLPSLINSLYHKLILLDDPQIKLDVRKLLILHMLPLAMVLSLFIYIATCFSINLTFTEFVVKALNPNSEVLTNILMLNVLSFFVVAISEIYFYRKIKAKITALCREK